MNSTEGLLRSQHASSVRFLFFKGQWVGFEILELDQFFCLTRRHGSLRFRTLPFHWGCWTGFLCPDWIFIFPLGFLLCLHCNIVKRGVFLMSLAHAWWSVALHIVERLTCFILHPTATAVFTYLQKNRVKMGNTPLFWYNFNLSRCQQPRKDPLVHHNFLLLCSVPTYRLDGFNWAMYR